MMDVDTKELCLQKIREFVYDEDKIVTATWLSKKLNISIQDCKILLEQFVQDHHDLNKDELVVLYALCGQLIDVNKFCILLVKDTELNSRRTLFKKVCSESICTIGKGKELDLSIVGLEYAFELNNPGEKPLSGSIIDENCIKREVPKRAPNPVIKNDAKTKQNLFANVSKKTQSNGVQKNDSKDTTKPQKLPGKKNTSNGIGSYFSKTQNESIKDKREEIQQIKEEKTASYLVDEKKQNEQVDEVTEEPQPKKLKTKNQKTKNTKKKSTQKRKRIIEADSSDSDDIFDKADGSEEEINIKNDSEEEEEEKPRPVIKVDMNAPKNKRRKLVNQTYEDEDGYILTKKEWVCVSDDESDKEKEQNERKPEKDHKELPVENKTKMNEPKALMKKANNSGDIEIASTAKNKGKKSKKDANQPTLLNFFKSK